jgi:protein phosphatase 1 regulatory subunit 7
MTSSESKANDGHAHIDVPADHNVTRDEGETSPRITNGKGWDGKLRVPKSALLSNPEALSDPEYSDDENVMEGEEIAADEGTMLFFLI